MRKKLLLFFVFVFLSVGIFSAKTKALEVIGPWYSDTNKISRYSSVTSPIPFLFVDYGETGLMDFADLVDHTVYGLYQWDSRFSIDFEYDEYSLLDNCIKFGVVSRNFANSMGVPGNALAVTIMPDLNTKLYSAYSDERKIISLWTHNNWWDTPASFGGSMVLLIWDTDGSDGSVQTSNFTDNRWCSIMTHEVGHAIGFWGHSTKGPTQIMYAYNNGVLVPQTYDIEQMKYAYSFGD